VARAGDELLMGDTGMRLVFVETSESTGGELVEVRAHYPPAGRHPPAHWHPGQEERFEIVSGSLLAMLDGEERTLEAGESLVVSPGVVHAMHNPGPEPTETVWQTRPALRTEELFEALSKLSPKPGLRERARLAHEFEQELRVPKPPLVLIRAIAALPG
jgi:mannose-6-phosphate isomerase-like protein (cupin superfamily)